MLFYSVKYDKIMETLFNSHSLRYSHVINDGKGDVMKKRFKQLISAMLALSMLTAMIPQNVLAANNKAETIDNAILEAGNDWMELEVPILPEREVSEPEFNPESAEDMRYLKLSAEQEANEAAMAVSEEAEMYAMSDDGEGETAGNGICGDTLTYSFADGVLAIEGTGEMYEFADALDVPWNSFAGKITRVEISSEVTSIGSYAFYYCTNMTEIAMPETIKTIGSYAFRSCYALTQVTIGSGVISIGEHSFEYCTSLTSAALPETISEIPPYLFHGCTSLETISLPDSMKTIGEYAFASCTSLKEIEIPLGLTEIGEYAFSSCSMLSELELPGSLLQVGSHAFYEGSGLSRVTLPYTLKLIPEYCFSGCSALSDIYIPEGVTEIGKAAFYNCPSLLEAELPSTLAAIGDYAFAACSGLSSAVLPDGLSSIGAYAFSQCADLSGAELKNISSIGEYAFAKSGITELTVPSGVSVIGEYAFSECTLLQSVVICDGISGIPEGMFDGCVSLMTVSFPKNSFSIGDSAFYGCTSLVSADIYGGSIGEYAFFGCTQLVSAAISGDIEEIGAYAFRNCSELETFKNSGSTGTIGASAFSGCSRLREFRSEGSVETIGEYALYSCGALESIYIDGELGSAGKGAFAHCSALESFTAKGGITELGEHSFDYCVSLAQINLNGRTRIGDFAFKDCHSLCAISFPSEMREIGKYAFLNCESLSNIIIPDGRETIDAYAFYGCSGLVTVNIPSSVRKIDTYAFYGCGKLDSLMIPEGTEVIGASAFSCCPGLKTLSLPSSLIKLGDYAFYNCSRLDDLSIPSGISEIGTGAFRECVSLSSLTLSEGLTAIGKEMFRGCSALKSITIPDSAVQVGDGAFRETVVSEIVIPETLLSIADNMFRDCKKLSAVTLQSGLSSIGMSAFAGCSELSEIEIPSSVNEIGAYAFSKTSIKNIVIPYKVTELGAYSFSDSALESISLPSGMTRIGEGAFKSCTALESITLPQNIANIGTEAFAECSALSDVTMPSSLTAIAAKIFKNCVSLTELDIPVNVTTIGKYAFSGCTGLAQISVPDSCIEINDYAFENCTLLARAEIPESVETIGDNVFSGCDAVVLYVIPDSYAYEYALNHGLEVSDLMAGSRVVLSVSGTDGMLSKNDYIVRWYYKGSTAVAGYGSTFLGYDSSKEYEYEVIPQNDCIYYYYSSGRQELVCTEDSGTYYAECIVSPVRDITVSGVVTDKNGKPLNQVMVEFTQTYNSSGTKTETAVTDPNGKYTALLKDVPTTAVFSGSEYYTDTAEIIKSQINSAEYTAQTVVLEEMPKNKIGVSMKVKKAAKQGEKASETAVTSFSNISFEVYNNTTGKPVTVRSQYPNLYPREGSVSAGDTVTVKAVNNSGGVADAETTVIMGDDVSADAGLTFAENGCFTAEVSRNSFALIFDHNGSFVGKYSADSKITSDPLEDGAYTVIFIANSGFMPIVSTLEKLNEIGIESGDYSERTAAVSGGVITDIGKVSVPDFDVTKLYYTVDTETYCMMNKSNAGVGEFISVRVSYELEDRYSASDEKVIIELPEDMKPIQGSLTLDGVKTDYTVTDHGIEIETGASSGFIKFYTMANDAGSFTVRAYLSMALNGASVLQPVGSAAVNVSAASLTLPLKTGRETVTVSGKAVVNSSVKIYDNGEQVAVTNANSAGSWSVKYTLKNTGSASEHAVYAVVETLYGVEYITDTYTLTYDPDYCEVERVTMINTAHGASSLDPLEVRTVFEFLEPNAKKLSYDYYPKYPEFTFVVALTGDNADGVTVITRNSHNDCTYISCEYDAISGNWVGTHEFASFDLVPSAVAATVTQGDSASRYLFEGTGTADSSGEDYEYTPVKAEKYTEPNEEMTYSVSSVSPEKGSNGRITLHITGELLEPNLSAALSNGTSSYAADKIYWKNHENVYAVFDLTEAPDGEYSLNITGNNVTASLENCFTLDSSLEKGSLTYSINICDMAGAGEEHTGSITAVNTGYTDVYAPVFELNGSNLVLKADEADDYADKLNVLIANGEGLAGVIRHGETAGCTFTYKVEQEGAFALTAYDCSVRSGSMYGEQALDTGSDKSEILTANMLSLMGTEYTAYSENAAKMANAANAAGCDDVTLDVVEAAYTQLAYNTLGGSGVTSATDLVSTNLSVNRSFSNATYSKAEKNIFGIGWSSGFETRAEHISEDGADMIMLYSSSSVSFFVKNDDGVYCNIVNPNITAELAETGEITILYENGQTMTFAPDGYPAKAEDIYGNSISYVYKDGKIVSVADSNGDSISFEYNGDKVSAVQSGTTGDRTVYSYDGDYLESVTTKYGTTSYTYDRSSIGAKRNALTAVTNAAGVKSVIAYDSIGRIIKVTSGDYYEAYSYGLNDITVTDSAGNTVRSVYDLAGNMIYTIGADNTVVYASYSGYLFTESIGAGLFKSVSYEYDDNKRPVKITAADGSETFYSWSETGAISGVTAPGGARTRYNRNSDGELVSIEYADGGKESFTYNEKGETASYTGRNGESAAYEYDSAGNLTKETYSGGQVRSFTYDNYGNILTVSENGEVTSLEYNAKGDLTRVEYPNGRSISYGYDDIGRQTSLTDSEGNVTYYSYDDMGRLDTVSDSSDITIEYEYNTDGTMKRRTNGNGTYTDYGYSKGKLSSIRNYGADSSVISYYEYEYNTDGYISSATTADGTESYVYDAAGQLTEVTAADGTVTEYEYNTAGNRTVKRVDGKETEYASDVMNRYTRAGEVSRSYDEEGNLISETGSGGTTSYEWDYLGRLIKVTKPTGEVYEFEYDAFGLRSAATVNGERTEYLNDPTGYGYAAAEYRDGEVTRYILDGGIVARESGGENYFFNSNQLGSVTEITDGSGNAVNSYKYSHDGTVTSRTEGVENDYTYVGVYGIAETGAGLWYDRARYISEATGSFISEDPSGQYYDLNLYRYANNNPANYVDYNGCFLAAIGGIGVRGAIAAVSRIFAKQATKKLAATQLAETGVSKAATEIAAKSGKLDYKAAFAGATVVGDAVVGTANPANAAEELTPQDHASDNTSKENGNPGWVNFLGELTGFSFGWWLGEMLDKQFPDNAFRQFGNWAGNKIGEWLYPDTTTPLDLAYACDHASGCTCGNCIKCTKPVDPKADPSGYVYAGVASNRIEGVETVIYYEGYPLDEFGEPDYDAGLQTLVWDNAADYNEENPQLTDSLGRYGWDTPEGKWRVKYTKDGYADHWSDWMEVPPEYTDVNINMQSTAAPRLERVNIYTDEIELRFDQYMRIETVSEKNITVTCGGRAISGSLVPENTEYNYEGTAQYASVFKFLPDKTLSGAVTVSVSGAVSYSGVAMAKDSSSGTAEARPQSIRMDSDYTVGSGDELTITAQILPKEAGVGKKLTITSYSPSIAQVKETEAAADQNGEVKFTVTGLLSGVAIMRASVSGTDISQDFNIAVGKAAEDSVLSIPVSGRYNTENILTVGLYRKDGTLISVKSKHPGGTGEDAFTFAKNTEAAYVKIMEWDSLEGMKPYSDAVTVMLQ